MGAFEKVNSGIPSMDRALDYIRLGDNVVWQVSSLDEFRPFASSFAKQSIGEGKEVIYVRFAEHPPILPEQDGLRIIHVKLSHRFETFTVNIHNLIEREGKEALYVFDCLSELRTAWAMDLMMSSFFKLTAPLVRDRGGAAYYPILQGVHPTTRWR